MNPVQLEIVKMDRQWQQEVKQHPDVPLFICLGERHELNLFEAYFKYQLSPDSNSRDIFLLHYQPFESSATYGQVLIDEWKEVFDLWQQEQEHIKDWEMDTTGQSRYQTDAYKPVAALAALLPIYPDLRDKKIFVQLAPVSINDQKELEHWVNEWCLAAKSMPFLKLVYADHHTHRTLKQVNSRREFRLQIDINQLMQHAAAYTNKNKNESESDYQQQLLIASNHLSKSRHDEGHAALERAISIAQQQGLNEAEATARLMFAQSLAAIRRKREAHQQYHLALAVAGTQSLIGAQMHMNYGSFLMMESRKTEARNYFDKAVQIAETIGNDFIAMECTRIVGQLSESKWNGSAKALEYYLKCIEMGKKMPPDKRRQSSMAYIALAIQKIYGTDTKASKDLEEEMKSYIGEDWKQLASLPGQHVQSN